MNHLETLSISTIGGGRSSRALRARLRVAPWLSCLALALALATGAARAADTPIAEVASLSGEADAIDAAGQVRALSVGDPIYAGESVQTHAGGTVGLWHDEALAQLPEKSKVRVDHNADGDPRFTLEEGAVRVVDPRKAGAPIELVALDSSSSVLGGDREARILREKAGAYSMICDWVKPVSVKRRAEGKTAMPGDCVIANAREPMFASPGHDQRIPLLAGGPLLADAGPAIDPASMINPLPPVGAGGPNSMMPVLGIGAPGQPQALRAPCTTVGAGCNVRGDGGGGIIEPPPGGDGFPGAGPGPDLP